MQPQAVTQAQLTNENKNQAAKTEQESKAKAEKDKKEFDDLLLRADKGDSKAQYKVGRCYKKGMGTAINMGKAFDYFLKSANQQRRAGLTSVGICYLDGAGVAEDLTKGITYLLAAVKQQEPCAENILGSCYLSGKGVPQSYAKALEYFTLSAEHGDKEAAKNVETTQKLLEEQAAEKNAKTDADKAAKIDGKTEIEKKPIQILIKKMIDELDTDIGKNKKMIDETSYIKAGAQFLASLGNFLPANPASKAVGGNKSLKVTNAKKIKIKLLGLLADKTFNKTENEQSASVKSNFEVNANTGAAAAIPAQAIVVAVPVQAVIVMDDIKSKFNKILDDFTALDLTIAGGGKHTLALIQRYRTEMNNLNNQEDVQQLQPNEQNSTKPLEPSLAAAGAGSGAAITVKK